MRDRRFVSRHHEEAFPLEKLPAELQERIRIAVAQDSPPERWLAFGSDRSPRPVAWIESRAWCEWHWQRGIDFESRRPPLPRGLRQMVIERDGYVCQLCRTPVEPTDIHIDHIKPWSKGGQHVLGNLQVAHSKCNMIKGARG